MVLAVGEALTRSEAVPGAVVVRLRRNGERADRLLWIVRTTLAKTVVIEAIGSFVQMLVRFEAVRLATPEEREGA